MSDQRNKTTMNELNELEKKIFEIVSGMTVNDANAFVSDTEFKVDEYFSQDIELTFQVLQ